VTIKEGAMNTAGAIDRDAARKSLASAWDGVGSCYVAGLKNNPTLEGRIKLSIVVGRGGDAVRVSNAGSDIVDSGMLDCIKQLYLGRDIARPAQGVATVIYELRLTTWSTLRQRLQIKPDAG
jgi:hypothetical protein